ncbi:MAG: hypothetical protein K2J68_06065 [Treponemataceae bacterium]|nr:hypothetical protein [Treponemataceae bacterium]
MEKDLPKRARYYQAMMDLDFLEKSKEYETLLESFVVFICTSDPFGCGLPRYTFINFQHRRKLQFPRMLKTRVRNEMRNRS